MKKNEDLYRALFESSGDALFVMNREEFLECNPRTLELFGCHRNEILGSHPATFSPKIQSDGQPSGQKAKQYIDRAFGGERLTFDWLHCRLDGTPFEAEVTLNPVNFGGEKNILASVRLMDARNLRRKTEIENQIEAQQNQKMNSLGLLAGGIAHSFNNFLLAIVGNADLLDHEINLGLNGQNLLGEIRLAAGRAADLCNQLLAFAGKGQCAAKVVDLSSLTREMVGMLQIGISRKISLRLDLDENLPCIEADASQIQQVIMNLVVNASESIGRAEGTISLSTGEHFCDDTNFDHCLRNETFSGTRHLFIQVSDTGGGMDQETMQCICDPFYSSKLHGRGLGLASVLGVIRAHHGSLCIRSKPGEGACLRVCFPLDESSSPSQSEPLPQAVVTGGTGLVLVVDDEEFLRVLCARMLGRMGYEVVLAASGREALEIYREQSKDIVFVILDLIMPEMDGVEVHEKMTAINPEARVIMTSGYHQQEIATRFAGRGMSGFIQKPYRFTDFEEIIRTVIESPEK